MPIFIGRWKQPGPISHSFRITAYILVQGYHGVNWRTKSTVQGHSMFLNFNMVNKISIRLLCNKKLFSNDETIDLIPSYRKHGFWADIVWFYQGVL